ncbi:hypothetical protein [Acinetobacter bereziniae]|uniref:hypothetical protein n=1 Tax=Acinetobacter bereziniae TaxID=106648 RepID=UPI001250A0B5|nr:hypothetical protein [Acinetobacter bereziniae]
MIEREPRECCEYCDDGSGQSAFPYYGLAPHKHSIDSTDFVKGEYPENFSPEDDGAGVWTHCLECRKRRLPEQIIQSIREIA